MIQEILVLGAVFHMTKDEAFYESDKQRQSQGITMQSAASRIHTETNSITQAPAY